MSDRYDELLLETKNLRVVKEKYDLLNVKVEELENKINDLDQYSRCKNIEIKGVEEKSNENLKAIVAKIAIKLGAGEVKENDIDIAHRINNRNKREPRDIIVQFKSRDSKEKILAKRREKVSSNDITNGIKDNLIYLNEHLTLHNKTMFWEARNKCREVNYKFVWTKDGKIFVRKEEKERAFRIRNLDDIKKIS